jgi:hypothetical protein
MCNCELRKDVEIMRKTLIVVELAPHSALPQSVVQELSIIAEAILLCRDDIARRKL